MHNNYSRFTVLKFQKMSRYAILRRAKQSAELKFYRRFGNVGSQTTPSMNPLSGIRVLDMSRILAGPYCSMILGDLGAEIVKVEQPGRYLVQLCIVRRPQNLKKRSSTNFEITLSNSYFPFPVQQ